VIRAVPREALHSACGQRWVISEITVHQLWATGGGARSACGYEFWQMFCKQNSLLPKQKKGCWGSNLAMVGVGAYPNLEAAFKILPQDSKVVQPQVNPVYEAAFKRYSLLYDALKAVR